MHRLQHVNIVALHAVVCESDHYGIVMEYVIHGALDEYILSHNVCIYFLFIFGYCAMPHYYAKS